MRHIDHLAQDGVPEATDDTVGAANPWSRSVHGPPGGLSFEESVHGVLEDVS
jgi:hypothetical protein